MLIIDEEITLAEIDEAIGHINTMLKIDEYGNRMTYQRKQFLEGSLDDLLDARLEVMRGKQSSEGGEPNPGS